MPNDELNLRLPAELSARLRARARADRRSLNGELVYLLEIGLGAIEADAQAAAMNRIDSLMRASAEETER